MMDPPSKTCRRCGETKPLDEFHRKADCQYGRAGQCKACRNAYTRKLRESLKPRYAAHQRRYRAEGRYVAQRRVYKIVRNAVDRGDLTRPDRCQSCGHEGRVEAHHDDYARPLDVTWLCPPCHAEADGRGKAQRAYDQAQLEFWSARERAA